MSIPIPMISIVIPLYNKEDCVSTTLQSVLNQSFTNFEIVVVDDGSTDKSLSIVSSLSDNRIRLFSQNNGGPSSARNRGLKESRADYIAFIDADDIWDPNYLKEMVFLINRFPDAVFWSFNYSVIEDRKIKDVRSKEYCGYVSENWDAFPFPFFTSASCCRKSTMDDLGGFDERIVYGEDLDMWFRLLLSGRGVMDSRVMVYYNKDVTDALTQHKIPLERHLPFFIDKYLDYRMKNSAFRRYFDEQMVYLLYPYLLDDDYKRIAHSLAEKLDYSLLKKSMRFRMSLPYTYRFFRHIKDTFGIGS